MAEIDRAAGGFGGQQSHMPDLQVTIVVVPREQFSLTQRSLENLYEHTTVPFPLVYVAPGAPPSIRSYLETAARQKNFQLILTDRFLSPNQARNLGQQEVKTKYVVFLDNDALVSPGWLEALVGCAEETGAWVVGPLYLIGEFGQQTVHMVGGIAQIKEHDGQRVFYDEHLYADTPLADVREPLQRSACDYVEFHCVLVRNKVFDRLGPLDEQLLSGHEHIDLGLAVRKAGGSVYIEPGAITTHIPPSPGQWRDLPYFMVRWSEAWNQATVRHFKDKWDLSLVLSPDDESNPGFEDTIIRWARGHRRVMAGLRIPPEGDDNRPGSFLEEAQCMIALFHSMDRDSFDLILTTEDEQVVEEFPALNPGELMERLPDVLAKAEKNRLNLMMRALCPKESHQVVLLRFDDLDAVRLAKFRPHAFLVLETEVQIYQCWVGVAVGDPRSALLWRRLGVSAPAGGPNPYRIAGSRNLAPEVRRTDGSDPHVCLVEGQTGLLNPLWKLEEQGLLSYLRNGQLS